MPDPTDVQNSIERMKIHMELRGHRPMTVYTFNGYARRFLAHVGKAPAAVTAADVESFLLDLCRKGRAARTRNVALAAVRCLLFATTSNDATVGIPRAKVPRLSPKILSGSEVARLLAATDSPKYRAIFMLAYGAGLRVGEIAALQVSVAALTLSSCKRWWRAWSRSRSDRARLADLRGSGSGGHATGQRAVGRDCARADANGTTLARVVRLCWQARPQHEVPHVGRHWDNRGAQETRRWAIRAATCDWDGRATRARERCDLRGHPQGRRRLTASCSPSRNSLSALRNFVAKPDRDRYR